MVKKRSVFLALFLALAVMLQYSFVPQTFTSYAGEISEGNTVEEPAPEPKSDPAPAPKADPAPAPASTSASSSSSSSASSSAAPASSDPAPASSGQADSSAASAGSSAAPTESSEAPSSDSSAASADSKAAPADSSANTADSGQANGTAAPADNEPKSEPSADTKSQPVTLKSTASAPAVKAATAKDELTIKYDNVIYSGLNFNPDKTYPYSLTDTSPIVKNASRAAKGFNNKCGNVGGGDTSYAGVTYVRLNAVVVSKSEGVFWDSLEGHDDEIVDRVYYDGDGKVRVKYKSGKIDTFEDCRELTLSPVYKQKQNWFADFNYIDYISTGSGSWSNLDAVYSYKHTFSDPSEKSPSLTEGKYDFRFWKNDDSEQVYEAGDELVYSDEIAFETYRPVGSREVVNIYAYWQPAIEVVYNVLGNVAGTEKNLTGTNIRVYDRTEESTVDGVTFEGWYDADGNRISEDTIYDAPGITKENNTAVSYNVFARYATSRSVNKVWDDGDNVDGLRTGSVTVQLYANGEPTGKTIVLDSANSWAAAFSDLDAYDKDGNLIEYTINEEAIPEGYSASVAVDGTSFTITNTHTPDPISAKEDGTDPTDKPTPAGGGNNDNGTTNGNRTTGVVTAFTNTGGTTGGSGGTGIDKPAMTTISDPDTPLALNAYWALVNLLCAIATALLSIIMLIRYFGKRREEDEETGEETEIRRKGAVRLMSIIPALGAIIAFILTEDMSNPMIMIDKWTVLMIVILAIQIVVAIFAKTRKHESQEEATEAVA